MARVRPFEVNMVRLLTLLAVAGALLATSSAVGAAAPARR